MSSNFIDKVLDVFGMGDDYGDTYEDNDNNHRDGLRENTPSTKRGKVVSINSLSNTKVQVVQPTQLEDMKTISDCLKDRKISICNLKNLDLDLAQRCVDFACGAISALDGNIQQVSPGVFLLAPNCVDVTSELKEELSSTGLFMWTNK